MWLHITPGTDHEYPVSRPELLPTGPRSAWTQAVDITSRVTFLLSRFAGFAQYTTRHVPRTWSTDKAVANPKSNHPYMALQPLPGLGLPHKTPPFIPNFSSSPSSYPQQLQCIPLDHIRPSGSWSSHWSCGVEVSVQSLFLEQTQNYLSQTVVPREKRVYGTVIRCE